jgi:MerR family transcriptional regulator, light-induced transcriptional regulator
MATSDDQLVRIGELSRRVGVSAELLRAWERRYGLLRPQRTEGGFRLYSSEDERRVRRMQELLDRGLSAAEAARAAAAGAVEEEEEAPGASPGWERDARRLRAALDGFDEQGAHLAFDRLLGVLTLETLIGEVVIPYLRELGERWAAGEATVAQEHFASQMIRGRLLGLARGWDRGEGPRAVLACAPGELHDLPQIAFGIALRGLGWRVTFLGADTPVDTLAAAADRLRPTLVVVSAVVAGRLEDCAAELAELARRHPLALAGAGASEELAARVGASLLAGDPVAAAASRAAA